MSLCSHPVSVPLWLLCGSLLECSGLCEQSLHGDALCSGKYNEFNTAKKKNPSCPTINNLYIYKKRPQIVVGITHDESIYNVCLIAMLMA